MADYTSTYSLFPSAVTDTFASSISASPPSDFASATCFDVSYVPMTLVWHRTADGCPDYWGYDGNRCTLYTDSWSDWFSMTYTFGCYIYVTPSTTSYVDGGTATVYDGPAVTELGGSITYTITVVDTVEIISTLTETPDPVTRTETSTRSETAARRERFDGQHHTLTASEHYVNTIQKDVLTWTCLASYDVMTLATEISSSIVCPHRSSEVMSITHLPHPGTDTSMLGNSLSEWCVGTNIFNSYCCDEEFPTNCAALEDPLDVLGWWATASYTYITNWQIATVYDTSTAHLPSTTYDYYDTTTETETQTSTEVEYETVTDATPTVTVTLYKTITIVASQTEITTVGKVTQGTSVDPGEVTTFGNSDTTISATESLPTLVTSDEAASDSSTNFVSSAESSTESANAAASNSPSPSNRIMLSFTTLLMTNAVAVIFCIM